MRTTARTWTAWLALALFVPIALLNASLWRGQVEHRSDQDFSAQAASIGASVTTAVRRMDDLTLAARTLLGSRPETTQAEFERWYDSMGVDRRFTGVAGITYVEVVRGRPAGVYPAGDRPYYCLGKLGVAGAGMAETFKNLSAPGLDVCQVTELFADTRDSGAFSAFVTSSTRGYELFEVIAPVYEGGGIPGTVGERRATVTGWIVGLFDAEPVLASAVSRVDGVSVRLEREQATVPEYRIPGGAGAPSRRLAETIHSASAAGVGVPASGDRVVRRMSVEADGRWTVTVTGAKPAGIADAEPQAALVLLIWLTLGVLVFAVMRVLGRGRARALKIVEEKTGQLRHQALHDALTGLPNRALIMERTEQLLQRARLSGTEISAMFIDLDGFKNVNDTFGHPMGDELLCVVAARIEGVLRETDTIGRLGGDEFVVLVDGDAVAVATRIVSALREPFELGAGNRPVTITTSIGIAGGDRDAAEDLLRDADIALYEAKGAGRNRYAEFRPEMHAAAHERLELESDLRGALGRGEFFLVYQPVIDFATDRMTAAEALLRWQHPTRGLISPVDFIPIAEESGVIVEIGAWVLETACEQAARWARAGTPIRITVNVSARQLDDPALIHTVDQALRRSGLAPDLLALEITETALMRDAESAAAMLRELRASGVALAIDDFGTGYSSLAYLQQFPVDVLKIDRAFISTQDLDDPLVATLVQLGRSLGLLTVAEGVENEAQLRRLRELGCDRGQGYLFAPPLELPALERFMAEHAPSLA